LEHLIQKVKSSDVKVNNQVNQANLWYWATQDAKRCSDQVLFRPDWVQKGGIPKRNTLFTWLVTLIIWFRKRKSVWNWLRMQIEAI